MTWKAYIAKSTKLSEMLAAKMSDRRPRLRGILSRLQRCGEKVRDTDGAEWEKCIFAVSIVGYSRRTPNLELDKRLVGTQVRILRKCSLDWHYKVGAYQTLTPEETEAVLSGRLDLTE